MIKCLNANNLYILMVTVRSKKWIFPAVVPLLHSKAGSKCGLCGMTIVFLENCIVINMCVSVQAHMHVYIEIIFCKIVFDEHIKNPLGCATCIPYIFSVFHFKFTGWGRWGEGARDVLVPSSACSMREVFRQKDELMLLLVMLWCCQKCIWKWVVADKEGIGQSLVTVPW